jgi:hypothetical protein
MKLDAAAAVNRQLDGETAFLELLRPLLVHDEFDVAATEFLSRFAQQLGCKRASLGFIDNDAIKVCAVSQLYQTIKHPVLSEVAAAMEESILQDATLAYPATSSDFPHILVAHAELARTNGLSSTLTVPLAHNGKLIGAVTLESGRPQVVGSDQLSLIELLVSHAGPLLKLKWSLEQPFAARCMTTVRTVLAGESPAARRVRLAAVAAFGLCAAAVLLIPAPHQVAGQARLEAKVPRVISAPIDGYLKEARVRPGDRVEERQPLTELNDESLRAEYRKLEAEAAQQLGHTQQRGSPLKRGDTLLTLSQGPDFRVIVDMPEPDIGDIKLGQRGKLMLTALPAEQFAIRVTRITPVATISMDGQNVFEVEVRLDTNAPKLVPGLKGVAKITTGDQPFGWQWLTRAWHTLSFMVWSKLG